MKNHASMTEMISVSPTVRAQTLRDVMVTSVELYCFIQVQNDMCIFSLLQLSSKFEWLLHRWTRLLTTSAFHDFGVYLREIIDLLKD